jgi:hypothetical protein
MTDARIIRDNIPGTLAAAFVPLFGLLVVLRGPDTDWDFRNYHWYNAYAWLTDRRDFDVAVAHHATYYNPLADIPVFALAQIWPAWLVGFLVGCVHGLNLWLLYYLSRAALGASRGSGSDWLALTIAVAGTTGGMALMLVGNASNDMTVTLFVLLALLLIVRADDTQLHTARELWRFGAAGLAGGMAAGLKLTMAPFAIGLAIGALVLDAPAWIRLQRLVCLGIGGFIGAALFGGTWAWTLWHETGNPVFPYFNDIIGSPLILDASYRDPRFLPESIAEALIYPFLFAWDGMQVSDTAFRDIKIALAYTLVPLTVLWVLISRRAQLTQAMRLLFTVCIVSYAVWLWIFGIYRYVLALEMLAPLLIALAVSLWPMTAGGRVRILAALWFGALLCTGWSAVTGSGGNWRDEYVSVTVPPIADPARTLAVMAGVEPMGYIVPAFPPQIPFLRIDGWLDTPTAQSAFGNRMWARIDAHDGPIFGVFIERERTRAVAAFGATGLVLANPDCATIESNVGEPLLWCALRKCDPVDQPADERRTRQCDEPRQQNVADHPEIGLPARQANANQRTD